MANWCQNTVEFSGNEQRLKEIDWLFKAMAVLEKDTRVGQLPPFVDNDALVGAGEGHFVGIHIYDGTVDYETKRMPNTGILVQIADYFQADFRYAYYEPGKKIFGEATYRQGILTDISLDQGDFELFREDEEGYQFEGQSYDGDVEILEILLERKKTGRDTRHGYGR